MKFLERTYSSRTWKEQKVSEKKHDAGRQDGSKAMAGATKYQRDQSEKRPNTSAGISEAHVHGFSKARAAARQDLGKTLTSGEDLQTAGRVVEYTDGLDTFRFPTPSPHVLPRSATFQYSPLPLQDDSPRIGVAIGSPSHAPPSWGRSFTEDNMTARVGPRPPSRAPPALPTPEPIDNRNASPDQLRRKLSWKPFGSLLRKSVSHASHGSFSKWRSSVEPAQPTPLSPQTFQSASSTNASPSLPSLGTAASMQRTKTPSPTRDQERSDAQMQNRTTYMPMAKSKLTRAPVTRANSAPSPPPQIQVVRASQEIYEGEDEDSYRSLNEQKIFHSALSNSPRTPKLLLEFPKPEFERYSVMFEKQLSDDSRPSLLERRQSKLQTQPSIKGLRSATSSELLRIRTPQSSSFLHRSLTSPHMKQSLPLTNSNHKIDEDPDPAFDKPSMVRRSNTAPPGALSPFASSGRTRENNPALASTPESPDSDCYSDPSLPSTPASTGSCTGTGFATGMLELNEPAWEMVTPRKVAVVSRLSPTIEGDEPYSGEPPSPLVFEQHQAVQVSVGRQISFDPTRMRAQKSMPAKQPLRPRVVELTKNRKSTVGVLETAASSAEAPVPLPAPLQQTRSG